MCVTIRKAGRLALHKATGDKAGRLRPAMGAGIAAQNAKEKDKPQCPYREKGRERERERGREGERERGKERERERESREKGGEGERREEKGREGKRGREREREGERERERGVRASVHVWREKLVVCEGRSHKELKAKIRVLVCESLMFMIHTHAAPGATARKGVGPT